MTDDIWREPLVAGTEAEHLATALGRLRATFRRKAGGLGAVPGPAVRVRPPCFIRGG